MDDTFFAYLQRLESMVFFSGYPLIYTLVLFIAGNLTANSRLKPIIVFLLPSAYALVGTLYLGLQLKNLYPDYSIENINQSILLPYLIAWGILANVFWIPFFSKKKVLSLLHSLAFFYFIIKDVFFQLSASGTDKNIVRNDMKLFIDSLLLNSVALITVIVIYLFFMRFKSFKDRPGV
ncbi:MAG: hypothetical protein ACSLE0_04005 [Chitinophagaceae bacterium]